MARIGSRQTKLARSEFIYIYEIPLFSPLPLSSPAVYFIFKGLLQIYPSSSLRLFFSKHNIGSKVSSSKPDLNIAYILKNSFISGRSESDACVNSLKNRSILQCHFGFMLLLFLLLRLFCFKV